MKVNENIIYASFRRRVAASIIDGVILGTISGALTSSFKGSTPGAMKSTVEMIALMFSVFYGVILESSSKQATVGKMLLGIKVTDLAGQPIGFLHSLGRHCCKIFSGIILGIGFLFPLFTKKKQALHDIIASCLALRVQPDSVA